MSPYHDLKNRLAVIHSIFKFILEEKSWWFAPLICILILFGVLVAITEVSVLGPLVYTLF